MFPIKYIDNNLVWNKDNEVFAYYELIPYNYSFLSAEQKFIVHDSFRQLIAQSREGKIHALQIATESSIRSMQEQSKKLVTGKLKEVAYQKIDEQTEALVSMIGDNQVDYRFFLGFKLMVTEEQLNLKNIKKSAWLTFTEFLHEVNHTLMNDFVSIPNDEINRYMKMEKLLENKISRRFKVRRLEINDFGYLMEHLYGRDGIAYEDYEYQLPKKELKKETLIKYYDLIRPTRCVIEESQRYLRLEHEDKESYVSYFTVNAIVGELDFPSSEIFYFQQQQFTFPVDTSMNVEIVENRKALTTVRNKKKELKDLDNHAYQAGSETSSNVVDALDSVDELETDLDQSKESKTSEADASVDADTVNDATAFLETFFKLYPTATEKELAYYVLGNVIEPIGRDYIYSELVNPIFIKDGDNVKVKVAVKFIDNQTKATQVSQYELVLHKDSNWKIVG